MKKEILESLKEAVQQIKKKEKGKIIDLSIERKGSKYYLKKGALIGATALVLATTNAPVSKMEDGIIKTEAAKKDKKKPVLKFKGKTKMTTVEGKSIKIPKVTAKDNKDGNITKKINVTVKKGNTNYKTIAKKIKNNKSVTFNNAGEYVITYTVKDKAGNKTSKKRYIKVKSIENEKQTTETPTSYVIEKPNVTVQNPVTTSAPVTTEAPATTEDPYLNAPVMPMPEDYANYDIKQITFDNNTYNVTGDENIADLLNPALEENNSNLKLIIENDYMNLNFPRDEINDVVDNYKYLKYYGKIRAYDSEGNDISNSILICATTVKMDKCIYIYAQDDKGNKIIKSTFVYFPSNFDEMWKSPNEDVIIVSTNPRVMGMLNVSNISEKSIKSKKLIKIY